MAVARPRTGGLLLRSVTFERVIQCASLNTTDLEERERERKRDKAFATVVGRQEEKEEERERGCRWGRREGGGVFQHWPVVLAEVRIIQQLSLDCFTSSVAFLSLEWLRFFFLFFFKDEMTVCGG